MNKKLRYLARFWQADLIDFLGYIGTILICLIAIGIMIYIIQPVGD